MLKLPVISKETIINNFNDFVSSKNKKRIFGRTGGTTGNPFKYISSKDNISMRWANVFRGWAWAGYEYGDKRTTLAGTSLIPDEKKSFSQHMRYFLENHQPLPSVHVNDKILFNHYKNFIKFKPKFLRGFPSILFEFASYISRNNLHPHKLVAIFSTAEKLYDFQKEEIENVFNCEIFDNYSNPESGCSAYECKSHKGLHLGDEWAITEILDTSFEPVKKGNVGELVATNLYNYEQPFIRYRTEDLASLSKEQCDCGINLPLLQSLQGRISDNLKFSNGVTIPGPMVVHIFRLFDQVSNYQLVQKNDKSVEINIVKSNSFKTSHENDLKSIMEHHCGSGVEVNMNFVDTIERTKGGKKQVIIIDKNDL